MWRGPSGPTHPDVAPLPAGRLVRTVGLDGPRSAQDPGREQDDGAEQREHSADRDADQPEREQHDPDDRVEHERQERERPAEHAEDAPEQEFDHDLYWGWTGRLWWRFRQPGCKVAVQTAGESVDLLRQ